MRAIRTDAIIASLLLATAVALGSGYARALRMESSHAPMVAFVQRVFGAALMSACGRGLTTPVASILSGTGPTIDERPTSEFLLMRREVLSCTDIPAGLRVEGLDGLQRASRYLLLSIAGAWTLSGPAWAGIDRLLGLMFGVSVALAYVASRVAMGRVVATGIAVLLMVSPLHLQNLIDVRDYSKTPFFLLTLCSIGFLLTRSWTPRVVIGVSVVTGAALGVGFGMRTDVLVNLLFVLAAVLACLPGRLVDTWKVRLSAAAAGALAFALVASPLMGSYETRASPWHVALLGYAHEWDRSLEVSSAPYEAGYFYSDSYVATQVDAYWRRLTHDPVPVSIGLPHYADASRSYYLATLTTFPADAVVRGWAAVIKILELPFSGMAAVAPHRTSNWLARVMTTEQRILLHVEPYSVPLFIAVLLGVSLHSVRLAAVLFALTVAFGAYPSIQFQRRHFFHLEFLGLWMLGLATSFAFGLVMSRLRGLASVASTGDGWKGALSFAAAVLAVILVPLGIARVVQGRTVGALMTAYSTAPTVMLHRANEAVGDGMVRLADAEHAFARPRAGRSMYSEMLAADVSGDCPRDEATLTFRYASADPQLNFTRTYAVARPARGHTTTVYFPVYEAGAAKPAADRVTFGGVDVPATDLGCVTRVARLTDPDRLSLLVPIVMRDDWASTPLYQRLRRWEGDSASEGRTSYWSTPSLRGISGPVSGRSASATRFVGTVDYNAGVAHVGADASVSVDGLAEASGSYLVSWQPQPFSPSRLLMVDGQLERGGLTVGLVDASGWAASVEVEEPGQFRAVIQAPRTGQYQVVVSNHLRDGALRNRFTISRIAIVDGASTVGTMK